jgi:uncharacterized protein YecE (DUF72 family)
LPTDFVDVVVATIAYQALLSAARLLGVIRRNCNTKHVLTDHNQIPTGIWPPDNNHSNKIRNRIKQFIRALRYYVKSYRVVVKDTLEIDSSFYRIPSPFMVKNWYKRSTQKFRFTAKFPKIITHDKRLKDVDKELERFFEAMHPLADKTLALLIQLPPSLHIFEGLERLRNLVPVLDNRFRYAVEVRHTSWFQDLAYNFFSNNDICLVWSQLAELQTPPILTTDFLYLRLIGDRSIHEKDFGRIQIDRVLEMEKWAEKIKTVQDDRIKLAIIAANWDDQYFTVYKKKDEIRKLPSAIQRYCFCKRISVVITGSDYWL